MIPPDLSKYREQANEAKELMSRLEKDGQLTPPSDPVLLRAAENTKFGISA